MLQIILIQAYKIGSTKELLQVVQHVYQSRKIGPYLIKEIKEN